MTWTTFANLGVGPGTTPQLDANFSILSALVPIPCTATGTNTITLTSIEGAAAIAAYQQNMIFTAIAANTSTGAATAQFGSLAALPIYKDAQAGPVALSGSEIVQFCQFTLSYDLALNSGGGGLHLQTGSGILTGQTLSIGAINGLSSVSGTSLNFSIGGFSSLSIAGGDAVVRLNSTLALVSISALVPSSGITRTVTMSGVQLGDNIVLGLPSLGASITQALNWSAFAAAPGSINVVITNDTAAVTVAANTFTVRFTDIGFVT
jgi:hypothetical protein